MSHILIAVANYYQDIADELLLGARTHLEAEGHSHEAIIVPGAFELPAALQFAITAADHHYDGYIALGCVIRGETTHYDYVCGECARGLQQLALEYQAPIGFGVLTVENMAQAKKRASVNGSNKGHEAAAACLKMIELKQHFGMDSE